MRKGKTAEDGAIVRRRIIDFVYESSGDRSTKDVARALNLPLRTTGRLLRLLAAAGQVSRTGNARATRYGPTKQASSDV